MVYLVFVAYQQMQNSISSHADRNMFFIMMVVDLTVFIVTKHVQELSMYWSFNHEHQCKINCFSTWLFNLIIEHFLVFCGSQGCFCNQNLYLKMLVKTMHTKRLDMTMKFFIFLYMFGVLSWCLPNLSLTRITGTVSGLQVLFGSQTLSYEFMLCKDFCYRDKHPR